MDVSFERLQEDFLEYLGPVKAGQTLVIYELGRPVAVFKPISEEASSQGRRPIGLAQGEFSVPDDFNDSLPAQVLKDFGA
jgi:antitoxin (DNA-binding transcriptional repressor) of toxin-antitoxin stability system